MCHSAPHCHTTLTLFCPGKALNWGQDLEKLGFTRSYFWCLFLTSCLPQLEGGNTGKLLENSLGGFRSTTALLCVSPYLNMSLPALLKHPPVPSSEYVQANSHRLYAACSYSPDALTRRPFAGIIRDKFNQPWTLSRVGRLCIRSFTIYVHFTLWCNSFKVKRVFVYVPLVHQGTVNLNILQVLSAVLIYSYVQD